MSADLTQYVPHSLLAALIGIVSWVGRAHVRADKEVADRVGRLEATAVTKEDITHVNDRIDTLGRELLAGQRDVLLAITTGRPRES